LYRRIVRWPPNWRHHGVVQEVHCTRADALGMVSIGFSGFCGWSPTSGRTRSRRGGLVYPSKSMATRLRTPWRGPRGLLHSRGCPGDGHHRSLWLTRVVTTSRTHPVAAGWTCIAELFDGHPIEDTMAWSKRSIALALMPWGWSPSISLAFAGHRQVADATGCGGVDLYRPIIRWPPNWGHRGGVQEIHCIRADAVAMVTIGLSGIRRWLPTRGRTRLRRGGLVSPNSSIATQLGTP